MLFRLFALGAVVFCGLMTTALVRKVYFPEFDRLPKVDPEHVLQLFDDNREPNEIYVYDATGEVVGDATIYTQKPKVPGEIEIRLLADGVVQLPNLPEQNLKWDATVRLGPAPERSVKGLFFDVRFSNPRVKVALNIDPDARDFYYTVSKGDVVVSDSRTDPDAVGIAQIQLMMAAWGVDPVAAAQAAKEQVDEGSGWDTRLGEMVIANNRVSVYFVVVEVPTAGEIRFVVTEAGELVEIATPLGYEMFSAAMRTPPDPLPYKQ